MWEEIFEMASNNGIWALLFVSLFFVQLKDSKTRESKYQTLLDSLSEKLKIVTDIYKQIEEIKASISKPTLDISKVKDRDEASIMEKIE